jgi:putative tricarboxylic transport membrane protein
MTAPTSAPGPDRLAAVVLIALAAGAIFAARTLPYWVGNAPGPGFVPFWLGVLLACAAAALLVRTWAGASARVAPAAPVLPSGAAAVRLAAVIGLTIATAVLAPVIGFVLASALFMGATLAYLRPGHARANWTATFAAPVVVWLLFVKWLAVPLPAGPFGF